MSAATSPISASPRPAVVSAAEPSRRPLETKGGLGSFGMALRLQVMPGAVEHLLGDLAGQLLLEVAQVDEDEVVVGATGDEPEALRRSAPRRGRPRCATTLAA